MPENEPENPSNPESLPEPEAPETPKVEILTETPPQDLIKAAVITELSALKAELAGSVLVAEKLQKLETALEGLSEKLEEATSTIAGLAEAVAQLLTTEREEAETLEKVAEEILPETPESDESDPNPTNRKGLLHRLL